MATHEPTNAPDLRSLPLGSVEGSMGASPARGTSDIDELVRRQAALPGTWRGALYGFGAGLAGVDPRAGLTDALRLQQGQQEMGMRGQEVSLREKALNEATRQHMVTTQLEVGKLVHLYAKDIGTLPKSARGPAAATAKGFLKPLMESLGMPMPEGVFDAILSSPEAADSYAGLVASRFGKNPEDLKRINTLIADAKTPAEAIKIIDDVFAGDVKQAGPKVMQVAETYMRHLKSASATTKQTLGMIDPTGKPLPLDSTFFLRNFGEAFKAVTGQEPTPAEHMAMQALLEDPKSTGFLNTIGLTPGTQVAKGAELRQKEEIEGGTPKARAELARIQAQTAEAGARTGQIRQDTATGKVVPFQAGGGIATIKPSGVEIVQAPGDRPPDVGTRAQMALGESVVKRMESLRQRMAQNPGAYFGVAASGLAAGARVGEQVGVGTANKEYEKFWADMAFNKAETLRAMEKGNIAKSDIDFFLAGYPKETTAPTAAVEMYNSAMEFAQSRLATLQKEFGRTPTTPGPAKLGQSADERARAKYLKKK